MSARAIALPSLSLTVASSSSTWGLAAVRTDDGVLIAEVDDLEIKV
jgi:hypothetical protein